MSVAYFEEQRREMIAAIRVIAEHLVVEIGKTKLDDRVLRAMAKVPRHEFVPIEVQPYAYLNRPLPIGFDKTISQPLMVAVMTDLLDLKPDDVVLEIGTGLGYQSAVIAELAGRVYTVELIDELAQRAVQRLKQEGYTNVEVRVGNGYFGWPEHAPFDKVIVTAAPDLIPPPLINQLKAGGRMVIPVGLPDDQTACRGGQGHERQSQDKGNYAGIVLVARGTRRACIPRILTTMGADISGRRSCEVTKRCPAATTDNGGVSPLQVRVCRPDIFRTLS